MKSRPHHRSDSRDTLVGWSALGAAALTVIAWAACCVLPLALSMAGISLAWTAAVAGQRTWLTVATVIVLSAGWWMAWRQRRVCALDATCAPSSGLMIGLLTAATVLAGLALIWRPLIEPHFLMLLRTARG